ncbi:hypothetical protein KY290_026051 [Solanum tuberosum]|uniref:FMN-dependent dehydrogenase domain-containing protein n=1 Tax=Solanum tuberosum TaxID=4113 RepID=A0ABQ7UXC0_SOLTU|nr:hypothetical protein KY284_024906 [Solanum tuberosum]KAH0755781.1 hypothetical protein KY290_026051 [Solanum tuberosum]
MKAIEAGVAGIIVSYHGARQLDYTPATIFVLEESCSHEMACNFIHCFRNPSGDYEWVDLDKPPPRYWLTKMASLFWSSDESIYDRWLERKKSEWMLNFYKMLAADSDRFFSCSVNSTTGDSRLPAFEASSFTCLDLSNCKVLVWVKKDLKDHSDGPTSTLCDVLHISTTPCAIEGFST